MKHKAKTRAGIRKKRGSAPKSISTAWVLSQLAGMSFPEQGQAYDFIKRSLEK